MDAQDTVPWQVFASVPWEFGLQQLKIASLEKSLEAASDITRGKDHSKGHRGQCALRRKMLAYFGELTQVTYVEALVPWLQRVTSF